MGHVGSNPIPGEELFNHQKHHEFRDLGALAWKKNTQKCFMHVLVIAEGRRQDQVGQEGHVSPGWAVGV